MSKHRSTLAASVAILCSAVLWGTLWIPLRRLDDTHLGGPWAITTGLLLPLVLLFPFALPKWRRIFTAARELVLLASCLALCFALYAEGLVRGQVARVILLFYLTPVWSTLLGRFFLGEAITGRRIATIALGLGGMMVVFDIGVRVPLPAAAADWMGLGAGMIWGLSMVYVKRTASHAVLDRIFVQFIFLGPVFFLVTLIPGGAAHSRPDIQALIAATPWLLALAAVWMLPVVWLTLFGASRIDPGRVGVLLMFEIVVALTTAALLAGEPFGARELIGALLIIGASGAEVIAEPPPSAPRAVGK